MERYFILDKFNTWFDWHLIVTAKDIPDAEPKTNYVELDGMSGTIDLSEALSGEVVYKDRTISATFWTDYGTRKDREILLRNIRAALHGKKIKITEPDDFDHYFYGRAKIKSQKNNLAYAELTIEFTCEPWRYALVESARYVETDSQTVTSVVIRNNGVKTLCPEISVKGDITLTIDGATTDLTDGTYKITNLKFKTGVNIVGVSGSGAVTFTYREADL